MRKTIKVAAMTVAASAVLSLCSFTVAASEGASDGAEYGFSTAAYKSPGAEADAFRTEEFDTATYSESSLISYDRYELSVSGIYNKNVNAYARISLSHDGKQLSSDARMINGTVYVAVRSFFGEVSGMTVTYYSSSRTLNVKGTGFEMDVIDGSNVIYANGRTLFSMTPSVIMTNGRMYAPLSQIAKAIGLSYSYNVASAAASVSGAVKPLTHGSTYYAEDAVYWLSRIISAESRGESLLGQIAVGSVVMNRVKSPSYPNTIYGVIFDRKYGVQFSPILDGSIYNAPSAASVVAAKICLEGFRVNTSALFFLYPRASTSSWIPNSRTYLFSIGKHDFYA